MVVWLLWRIHEQFLSCNALRGDFCALKGTLFTNFSQACVVKGVRLKCRLVLLQTLGCSIYRLISDKVNFDRYRKGD